ncbi:protogenin B isoform X2 [Neodiprion lecontei]|uniref:Protogenin B isoform X2 n=1 Tax=Neodiprion lecontei TaxID=441921 RepID=A0A6J0BIY6_NEOLC|nr:protogenin B isoform X2 [Neodiprion lecontei]
MAARVFLLSILLTEALRTASFEGVKGVSISHGGLNVSKPEILELERNERLGVMVEEEPNGSIVVGRRGAILNCSIGNNQNVSWLRNGLAAPPCGLVRCKLRNGSLHFLKMTRKSKGQESHNSSSDRIQALESYRCVTKNAAGSLRSSPAFLQIADLSREFDESPQDLIVHEGEVARFSCYISSIPFPPNITWQHNGQFLPYVRGKKYFLVSPGVLYISATNLSDAGSYRCVVNNKFLKKTRKSKEAQLHVIPKIQEKRSDVPIILFPQISSSYKLIAGSDLTLVCAASGFPTLVTWTFVSQFPDGAGYKEPRVLLNSTGSVAALMLEELTIADAGIYDCSVKNSNVTLQTQNITIDVLIPPTFIMKPINQVQPSGRTARFECQAEGRPTPQIYWLKDSVNITMNPREKTFVSNNNKVGLVISSTVPSDAGIYQCVAVNVAGEIWAAGRLQVTKSPQRPPIPTSLHCHALSPDIIHLSWKIPQTMPFPNVDSYFTVHYALAEPGSREDIALPEPNSTVVDVKSLMPFTNYTMYVRTWNTYGSSEQSASVNCATAASVPIAAPMTKVKVISPTKLEVSWAPLNKTEARGFILEYKLQWRLQHHPSSRVLHLPSAVNQYTLTNLVPGKSYEIRVLARTEQGWPNVSDSQLGWTNALMPSTNSSKLPPTDLLNLNVANINSSTVKLSWNMNGETQGWPDDFDLWQLYYQNVVGKNLTTTYLPKNCTEYILTDLEADASYDIGLCMISSGKLLECFQMYLDSKRLIEDHTLTNLEGVPVSSTAINVTWSAAPFHIDYCYEVCYNTFHPTIPEPLQCFNTTNMTMTVRHLKPFTIYQFKVRILYNTSERVGLYSKDMECRTNQDIPGTVREIKWFLSNITEVGITWKPPSKTNGVIRNYTIFYTTDPFATPLKYWANITVPGANTTAKLPRLIPSTRYFVEVRAATDAGYGKSSDRIIFHTGDVPKNSTDPLYGGSPSPTLGTDQSFGIIVGVSISTCFIVICLSSIYFRKKWENTQSPQESLQSLKDRGILRNGNGRCAERNTIGGNQHACTASTMNDIELTTLCPPSPKSANSHIDTKGGCSNGIVECCMKDSLLTVWNMNDDSKDLDITINPQFDRKGSTSSHQQPQQDLDRTRITMLNSAAASSCSSLNNNFECLENLLSLQQVPSTSVPVVAPNG